MNKIKKLTLLLALVGGVIGTTYLSTYAPARDFFVGIFAADNRCSTCSNLTYYEQIDPRIGVVHASGSYPDLHLNGNYLYNGAFKSYQLGFRTIEMWLTPNVCSAHAISPEKKPYGFYQSLEWCKGVNNAGFKPEYDTLVELAKSTDYKRVLGQPFHTLILPIDSLDPAGLTQAKVQNKTTDATQHEKDIVYKQVYDFATYLLEEYAGTGKTFVLVSGNELDNRLTAYSGCNDNWNPGNDLDCSAVPAGAVQSRNAIQWINTIQTAVSDARRNVGTNGVKLYHSVEVNHVMTKKAGVDSSLNKVLPFTSADLYSYSAHELRYLAINQNKEPRTLMKTALNKLAAAAPNSVAFGEKNLFIGEMSIGENAITNDEDYNTFKSLVQSALDWGAKYVVYWAVYDSDCDEFGTTNNESCRGLWMLKPDGQVGEVYKKVSSQFKPNKSLTATLYNGAAYIGMKVNGVEVGTQTEFSLDSKKEHKIQISYKNTGKLHWTQLNGIRLATTADWISFGNGQGGVPPVRKLGPGFVALAPTVSVKPGGVWVFNYTIPAHKLVGVATMSWKTSKSQIESFGEATPPLRFTFY